jgi:ankyrin repeat protein
LLAKQLAILKLIIEKQAPALLSARRVARVQDGSGFMETSCFDDAVAANHGEIVEAFLEHGAVISYEKRPGERYPFARRWPSVLLAAENFADESMALLASKGAFENWRATYSEEVQGLLVSEMVKLSLLTVGPAAIIEPQFKARAMKTLDVMLGRGFNRLLDSSGNLGLFEVLVSPSTQVEERDVLNVFRKYREAGADLSQASMEKDWKGCRLLHYAASSGWSHVVEFAIKDVGCPVDSIITPAGKTPLSSAIGNGHFSVAKRLITHYGAKICLEGLEELQQPISRILVTNELSVREKLTLLTEGLKRQKDALDAKYHFPDVKLSVSFPPIVCATVLHDKAFLECLLDSGVDGLEEAVNQVGVLEDVVGSPLQLAVHFHIKQVQGWSGNGASVGSLLRAGAKATTTPKGDHLPYGLPLGERKILPSALDLVRNHHSRCSRHIAALIEAAAAKERQANVKPGTSAGPVTSSSNTFEEPGSKVLTEADEKKKAKKRAAKKKAKAKKKAAAAAEGHAGAGKVEEGDSDSSSSGEDEEEAGLDEEERMLARAPTFDLEKEKAARRARAEAESKSKGREGEDQKGRK